VPFPAVDPEPEPRPLWRRVLVPVAVVTTAAVVVVLVLTLPRALTTHHKASARAAGWPATVAGEVIGWDPAGHRLLAMKPTGTLTTPSGPVLASRIANYPSTSPSGFGLLVGGGRFLYLENRHLTPGPTSYPPGSFRAGDVYGVSPFASHDTSVVVGGQGLQPEPQTPAIIALDTGDRRTLRGDAPADQVVGDPATRGAWVSVAHGLPTGTSETPQQPDSRIEYRRPGGPPVVLTTALAMSAAAKIAGPVHLSLTPYPAPSGKEIAVDVRSTEGSGAGSEAIVVVTRTGDVVGQLAATGLQQLAWSTTGSRLLLLTPPGTLTTWLPGDGPPPPAVKLPSSPTGWGGCVFSPFGGYVVCAGFGTGDSVEHWALMRVSDRAVVIEVSHEVPVDWSP
jgi:hypothetical protein